MHPEIGTKRGCAGVHMNAKQFTLEGMRIVKFQPPEFLSMIVLPRAEWLLGCFFDLLSKCEEMSSDGGHMQPS